MHALTSNDEDLLPSDEDVRFYEEHGWFITPPLFTKTEIAGALEAVALHHAGHRDAPAPTHLNEIDDWRTGSPYRIRLNDYVALTNEPLGAFLSKPVLAATAARLAGASEIRLWQSGIMYKEPGVVSDKVTIGWHTDRAYWRSCSSTRMLTAWIALQDCDPTMGTVSMMDGSHRWPDTEAVRAVRYGRTFMGTAPATLEERLERSGMPLHPVPLTLRVGQVSFHHCMTLHGSGPNRGDRPRIGLTAHLQDGANHYQRVLDEQGNLCGHANDRACRKLADGSPDYADPAVCPVLWKE